MGKPRVVALQLKIKQQDDFFRPTVNTFTKTKQVKRRLQTQIQADGNIMIIKS
jgi:hypothetical protein